MKNVFAPAIELNAMVQHSLEDFAGALLKKYSQQIYDFDLFVNLLNISLGKNSMQTYVRNFERELRKLADFPETFACHLLIRGVPPEIQEPVRSFFQIEGNLYTMDNVKQQLIIYQNRIPTSRKSNTTQNSGSKPSGSNSGRPSNSNSGASGSKTDTSDDQSMESIKLKNRQYQCSTEHPDFYPTSLSPFVEKSTAPMRAFLIKNNLCTYCRREVCIPTCKKKANNL